MSRGAERDERDGNIHWQYFIAPDKAASPQFDELCRGLAKVIVSPVKHNPALPKANMVPCSDSSSLQMMSISPPTGLRTSTGHVVWISTSCSETLVNMACRSCIERWDVIIACNRPATRSNLPRYLV